ncbi:MAG: sugar ABC transporter substrate-binding protein [Rhodobacteraceae bacterium]|nr:sugar ABC transporter substrate-binding protein [Paracoccaceae bacterium]
MGKLTALRRFGGWLVLGAAATFMLSVVPASAGTKLDIVWMGWAEEMVKPLMDWFEQENPDIKLNYQRIPYNELLSSLEVRLGARTPEPDIYSADASLTASYAARGHLMDLTPHFKDDLARFDEAALQAASYRGKVFAGPFATSTQLMYVNVDLFKAAGVELPGTGIEDRWTWEQVLGAAKKIAKPQENIWGILLEQSDRPYQLLPLMQSRGAKVVSDDGLVSTGYIDGDKFVEATQFYGDLFGVHKVSPPGLFDLNLVQEVFHTGRAAMMVGGTWNLDRLNAGASFKWIAVPHPYFEGGTPVTSTGSWQIGINPRSKNPEAALKFMRFFMRDDVQVKWFNLRPYPPVLKANWSNLSDRLTGQPWKIAKYELQNTAVPRPPIPGFREYEEILKLAFRDIQQGAPVKERLTRAAREIDRELAKYK